MATKDKAADDAAEKVTEETPAVEAEATSEAETPETGQGEVREEKKAEKKAEKKSKKKQGTKMKKLPHGKKYREYAVKINRTKKYDLDEALDLLLESKDLTKFDATAEIHMNLGVDPKHADQTVRSTVVLPHGTGKKVKIVAFVDDSQVKEAKAAGAIEAGTEDLISKIEKGWTDFDIAVAAPDQMKMIGKVAKTLGQKGLMPNPKAGTVTPDIKKTIEEISSGKIEFRVDKLANLHNSVGKLSFGKDKLAENIKKYVKAVQDAKPTGAKGTYIKTVTLASTMGPGIKIDLGSMR
jgi:large subunit ribosomal protein L1